MPNPEFYVKSYETRLKTKISQLRWQAAHLDAPLIASLLLLAAIGLFILFSAGNKDFAVIAKQGSRLLLGFIVMIVTAQIPPDRLKQWAPWLYTVGVLLLLAVLILGKVGHGAQRWLSFGIIRFQPSEVMKLATPMMIAYYLSDHPLPAKTRELIICSILILIPTLLTAKQPDLGTGILIFFSGIIVILLAGMSWKMFVSIIALGGSLLPFVWHFMHSYQKQRILTLLHPERDPLGTGYHIIQSKIAIGSGGLFGKGWLQGTQSHLQFLPEHATDFIFAVSGEELGFIGGILILAVFVLILGRCLYMSTQAQNSFGRLLAGSLSFTFFIYAMINIGMVIGILPVVGVPLPLISYGGTSMMTMLASFGIIMSIYTHRKLLPS